MTRQETHIHTVNPLPLPSSSEQSQCPRNSRIRHLHLAWYYDLHKTENMLFLSEHRALSTHPGLFPRLRWKSHSPSAPCDFSTESVVVYHVGAVGHISQNLEASLIP